MLENTRRGFELAPVPGQGLRPLMAVRCSVLSVSNGHEPQAGAIALAIQGNQPDSPREVSITCLDRRPARPRRARSPRPGPPCIGLRRRPGLSLSAPPAPRQFSLDSASPGCGMLPSILAWAGRTPIPWCQLWARGPEGSSYYLVRRIGVPRTTFARFAGCRGLALFRLHGAAVTFMPAACPPSCPSSAITSLHLVVFLRFADKGDLQDLVRVGFLCSVVHPRQGGGPPP